MRVIAGKFRSRQLRSTRGMDVRPTSDRLRETLFNVLTAGNPDALEGSVWLDLFAGTGAVGIEALSRGAAKVYFVDQSRQAVNMIRENLNSLTIASPAAEVLNQGCAPAIPVLNRQGINPDYIFLDPPYASTDAYQQTLQALGQTQSFLGALVIVEHEKKFDPGESFEELQRFRKLQQGDAVLSFYKRAEKREASP